MRLPNLAALIMPLSLAFAAPALAAGPGDVYFVTGVAVDVTAQDSSRARDTGFQQAQELAFQRLAQRLTLPDELARIGAPKPSTNQLDQIVDGVDIQQEQRSGVRYLARLGVNFNRAGAAKLLRDKGLNVLETRTAPVLVVPVFTAGTPEQALAWRNAWLGGGFGEELVPVGIAPDTLTGQPDWAQAQAAAAPAGAASAIYAVARIEAGALKVRLTEVAAGGGRDRGELSTPLTSSADGGASLFPAMAAAANDRIQTEWKLRLAAGAGQRARVAATAVFTTQSQWLTIKRALAQATQTLVADIQIEAVAADGAVLSFSHLGAPAQLAAELGRYGVAFEARGQTATLRANTP